MNIAEFKKKNKPKKISSLKKFQVEILELHNANYSLKSITLFLKNNGIDTTFQNVSRFINNIDKDNLCNLRKKIGENEKVETIANEVTKKSFLIPRLEKIGKDLDLKEAPDWAN